MLIHTLTKIAVRTGFCLLKKPGLALIQRISIGSIPGKLALHHERHERQRGTSHLELTSTPGAILALSLQQKLQPIINRLRRLFSQLRRAVFAFRLKSRLAFCSFGNRLSIRGDSLVSILCIE